MGIMLDFKKSFLCSFCLHACIFLFWSLYLIRVSQYTNTEDKKIIYVEIEEPKKNNITEKTKRIVQTAQLEKSTEAPQNAFLGAQNQKVDQETMSLKHMVQAGSSQTSKIPEKAMQKPKTEIANLGLALLPHETTQLSKEHIPERLGDEWNAREIPQDYIRGVRESDRTALNTKEYMFYSYFQRIRQRLDLAWGGTLREKLTKLYRSGRELASDVDHITKLIVILNGNGEVVKVQVIEESGVRDLDEAAIKAFNQSGPFPNPPKGLVDRQGIIKIRWDFILKT
ncbi:MAG: energy transducer TonB [Deltaproteobacteria bacterium]|nr:energy transducer TonB [Deltaproteobacteria bacterium]MBI4925063.1 energy transducer TonB [Bdellovibrio sp.]